MNNTSIHQPIFHATYTFQKDAYQKYRDPKETNPSTWKSIDTICDACG